MPRRLLTLAAALSLVLCAATAALWVRSHSLIEGLIWRYSHAAGIGVATGPGRIYFGHSTEPDLPGSPRLEYVRIAVQYPLGEPGPAVAEFAGFGLYNAPLMTSFRVPFWFVFGATAASGACCWRHARAPRAGRCPGCGYDLRATPARCPECGAAPAANACGAAAR